MYGEKSGEHTGKLNLSDDSKTLTFVSAAPFFNNEHVKVVLQHGLISVTGERISSLQFEFKTWDGAEDVNPESVNNEGSYNQNNIEKTSKNSQDLSYPVPEIDISKSLSPGYIFSAPSSFIMITDNKGVPVFYRNVGGSIYDFDLQPGGILTYFQYPTTCIGLDSSFDIVRKYEAGMGYGVDVHDLIVLPNGHYFIFGKKAINVDMSKIVTGGDPNAQIYDMALQEFDSNGNQVFQWSALDHYKITDADSNISLTDHTIDFVHLNSIYIDSDSNIIISARNLDEITKINHITGDIMWRFGGKNNQFTFINDNIGFSRQHDVRKISNGDITIFDNGVYETPQRSSFVEYKLDIQNKTAQLVRRYTHSNEVYGETMGNVEELPNGNMFIGWGQSDHPAATEINPQDSIVYEINFSPIYQLYRTFRYNWKTTYFKTNVDTINFGKVSYGDSATKKITIYNPQDTATVIINDFYSEESSYSIKEALPINIDPHDSVHITIKFKPRKHGKFNANLNIRYVNSNELIARQVYAKGATIVLPSAITPPSNLTAIRNTNESITLTWKDNSDNEAGFIIERKNGDSLSSNNFSAIDTATANDTIYIDNSVVDSSTYTYAVYAFNIDTVSTSSNQTEVSKSTSVKNNQLVSEFRLYQNFPNPFNPTTQISYEIPHAGFVKMEIFNILGEKISTLINQYETAGKHNITFDASNLSSGIYIYQLRSANSIAEKKLTLLK